MKTNNTFFKQIAKLGLLLMMGLAMTACGAGNKKWKEEVQLSDGKIIVIERQAIYESGGAEWASNRSGTKIKADVIRFLGSDGSGKIIDWKTRKIDSATYPEVPLVFDIEAGKPTVFTLLSVSAICDVYSKYVYQNGIWIEEKLTQQFEPHTTNLLFGSQEALPSLLKLQEKYKRNDKSGYRQALKHVGPSIKVCGE